MAHTTVYIFCVLLVANSQVFRIRIAIVNQLLLRAQTAAKHFRSEQDRFPERVEPIPAVSPVAGPAALLSDVQRHSTAAHAELAACGTPAQRLLLGEDDADRWDTVHRLSFELLIFDSLVHLLLANRVTKCVNTTSSQRGLAAISAIF